MIDLVEEIMIAVLVTLVCLTAICFVVCSIAECYDYFEQKPITRIIKKIVHGLIAANFITVFLVIGFLVVAPLWVNIFN